MTLDEVAEMALALPDVHEGLRHGQRTWFVRTKAFAWERPFTKADVKRFGNDPVPGGPILAVGVADLEDKAAALVTHPGVLFTIAHFEGYPAVLVQLDDATKAVVAEVVLDAWLACAPAALASRYLSQNEPHVG
jgi:hypothetical protein